MTGYTDLRDANELALKSEREVYRSGLAKRFGVSAADLMPWHYQNSFFQEAPNSIFGEVDLDRFTRGGFEQGYFAGRRILREHRVDISES